MMAQQKSRYVPVSERSAYHRFEDVIGCKWSSLVVVAVSRGVHRPGELERYIPGISTKVLNERLRKLVAFGVLNRKAFDELPARVEYHLSPIGTKLAKILEEIRELSLEAKGSTSATREGSAS